MSGGFDLLKETVHGIPQNIGLLIEFLCRLEQVFRRTVGLERGLRDAGDVAGYLLCACGRMLNALRDLVGRCTLFGAAAEIEEEMPLT